MLKIYDLFAVWCSPYRVLKTTLLELKQEYPSIEFIFVDVEDPKNSELAEKFKVRSIPMLVFEKDEEIVEKLVGLQHKDKIVKLIQQYSE